MSRIDELIAEHCPDGVQYLTISELFETRNGYTPSKANKSYWDNGTIPWFRMDDIRENGGILSDSLQHISESAVKGGKLFPANSIIVATSATIGVHALITVEHLSNQRFTSLTPKKEFKNALNMKFAYYYGFILDEWCLKNTTTSSFASVDMANFRKFKFPVPPLEVQEEIVRILDKFSQLEAELEAELEARKQQYEHYKDFIYGEIRPEKWVPLGSIGTFERGSSLQKKHLTENGIPCFHYGEVYTHYGISANTTKSFVDHDFATGKRMLNPGDVFIATTSENEEDLGKAVAWLGDRPAVASNDAYIFRNKAEARFVSYFFSSTHFQDQKRKFITGTKVKRISGNDLERISIPIPEMSEQIHIAEKLDKFDALVNDISTGLPAELKARRQQYEYYRDKLLTFKELEVKS